MSQSINSSRKIKVTVIGAGIGQIHLQGYKGNPDVEIAAVVDLNEDRARQAATEYGAKASYSQYADALADPEIDAVSVCTPNFLHAEVVAASLQAGKHVLCEKPMADTLENAQKIVKLADAARAKGQIFMMGMNNRFRRDSQYLKAAVESGNLGEVYYARCGWVRRNGIPGLGGWFTTKALSGGGPLIDLGVHMIDLTMFLMGNPKPVSAFGSTYAKFGPRGLGGSSYGAKAEGTPVYDVEDFAAGMIKFDNGATLSVEASWASHVKSERTYVSLLGTEGGADLDPLAIYTTSEGVEVDTVPNVRAEGGGHIQETEHFIKCIQTGKEPISTAEQGLHILQILDAIYRSAESGHEVVIK